MVKSPDIVPKENRKELQEMVQKIVEDTEKKPKEKAYCSKCLHLEQVVVATPFVNTIELVCFRGLLVDTWVSKAKVYDDPTILNRNNDCEYYRMEHIERKEENEKPKSAWQANLSPEQLKKFKKFQKEVFNPLWEGEQPDDEANTDT